MRAPIEFVEGATAAEHSRIRSLDEPGRQQMFALSTVAPIEHLPRYRAPDWWWPNRRWWRARAGWRRSHPRIILHFPCARAGLDCPSKPALDLALTARATAGSARNRDAATAESGLALASARLFRRWPSKQPPLQVLADRLSHSRRDACCAEVVRCACTYIAVHGWKLDPLRRVAAAATKHDNDCARQPASSLMDPRRDAPMLLCSRSQHCASRPRCEIQTHIYRLLSRGPYNG